jgi:hypothetical protein
MLKYRGKLVILLSDLCQLKDKIVIVCDKGEKENGYTYC